MAYTPDKPQKKSKIQSSEDICVTHHGDPSHGVDVFLFQDVVDELLRTAQKANCYGLLCGNWCLCENLEDSPREFIEITSYRDAYPMRTGFDYVALLRRNLNLTDITDAGTVLGLVMLRPTLRETTLEEVFLMRTYFNQTFHVGFVISAEDASVKCYRLSENGQLVEIGYNIVSLKS